MVGCVPAAVNVGRAAHLTMRVTPWTWMGKGFQEPMVAVLGPG